MTNRDVDLSVAAAAGRQHGAFSRAQAYSAGAYRQLVTRRVAAGAWLQPSQDVFVLPGRRPTWEQRLWIAYLAAGIPVVVSHEAAAALHGLTGFPKRKVTLTVPHPRHLVIPGAVVHQISDAWWDEWRTTVDGLAVTSVARTLVDLCAVAARARVASALDDAVAAKKTAQVEVARCLASVTRRGKRGLGAMATILDKRGPGYVPPASEMERRLFRLLEGHALPGPVRQHPFPGRQIVAGCVDAAYPAAKLILECDGRRWHTRLGDLARDHQRDNEAARAGWLTLRLLWEELVGLPDETADLIRTTLRVRQGQLRTELIA